jgi:hypothetical protein
METLSPWTSGSGFMSAQVVLDGENKLYVTDYEP